MAERAAGKRMNACVCIKLAKWRCRRVCVCGGKKGATAGAQAQRVQKDQHWRIVPTRALGASTAADKKAATQMYQCC